MRKDLLNRVASDRALLDSCETLMLDMDGTVLDLAFDNYMWLTRVPEAYAEAHGMSGDDAKTRLYHWFHELRGTLDWYCLDQWSDRLDLDVIELHRQHRHQIGFLPGARDFLAEVQKRQLRVLLVTNSHPATLDLKADATGLAAYFDRFYSSHDLGHPKEDQRFWHAMLEEERFDCGTTVFIDDTLPVLQSAADFGVRHLRHITRPDTSQPLRAADGFLTIESVTDLLQSG